MKFTATTFVLLFVGIFALPQDEVGQDVEARLTVTNRIQRAVNDMNQRIVELGLDPVLVDDWSFRVNKLIGGAEAHVKGLKCSGLARNMFTRLSFSAITMRLNFELVWPRIACEITSLGVTVRVLGRELDALSFGVVELINTRVGGSMRVRARPISGVSISECQFNFDTIIRSNLNVSWQGRDISNRINGKVEAMNRIVQDYKDLLGRQVCVMLEQVI